MRLVFMGTPEFAVPSLKALLDAGHEIACVITAPDKPAGRGLRLRASATKEFALTNRLKIVQPTSLREPVFQDELRDLKADLFVVVAFRILPQEVIDIPAKGAINLHASLLPQYRGAAPINWAIMNGEKVTGVTTFFIEPKVDTGNILLQESTSIGADETAGELHDRLMQLGAELVSRTVNGIQDGTLTAKPQIETGELLPAPKIRPDDCQLAVDTTQEQAHNFIRGLSPNPGAWIEFDQKRLKLIRSKMAEERSGTGIIFTAAGKLFLTTANGVLELLEVQPEGRRRMSGEDFVRGWR